MEQKENIKEPAREIPVLAKTDVLVAGGGMSGVIAAIAAARTGAKTILVERFSCLGGTALMGLPIQGYFGSGNAQIVKGIAEEFRQRLIKKGGTVDHFISCEMHNPFVIVQPEIVKFVCQEMLLEEGVKVLLDATVVDTVGTPEHIHAVLIEGKSGRQAIVSKVFIDCTGDADLVVRAGLKCQIAKKDELQASTLNIILTNVDKTKLQPLLLNRPDMYDVFPFIPKEQISHNEYYIMAGLTNLIQKAIAENGEKYKDLYRMSSYITLPYEGNICVNSVHVSGESPCDTEGLSRMELNARTQVELVVDFMREYVPGFEHAVLMNTGPWLGIRESRIICGYDTLTLDNIKNGDRPENTIALGGYPYDFHEISEEKQNVNFAKVPTYGIPYGCLVPRGTGNLLVAGKTISATREAMSSSRVMAQCMAEGHAAGTAAALCVQKGCSTMDLDISLLRAELVQAGAVL